MTIEKIKNWAKKHKKGIILKAGGAAAATIGIIVFRDHYFIVPSKRDMFTIARDSEFRVGIPAAMNQLGDVNVMWRNQKHLAASIENVPLAKLGEAGKAIQESCVGDDIESVGILITIPR